MVASCREWGESSWILTKTLYFFLFSRKQSYQFKVTAIAVALLDSALENEFLLALHIIGKVCFFLIGGESNAVLIIEH